MTDRLLKWMSLSRARTKERSAKNLLASTNPFWMLEDLSLLAHIEVEQDGAWRVAPPALAVIGNEIEGANTAILCGARTQGVLERLRNACELNGAAMRSRQQINRPQCIIVEAPSASELAGVATASGLPCQRDAGFTLLACLPPIRDWPRDPCEMVAGKVAEVKRFSKSKLHWLPSTLEEASQAARGLFRIKREWDWLTLLKSGKNVQAKIDIYAGRLATAAGAKQIHLNMSARTLRIPLTLKPPIVISRSLTLCSGILPDVDRGIHQLIFHNVPVRTVRLAVSITGLRVA